MHKSLVKASFALIPFIAMVSLALMVPEWLNQIDLDFTLYIVDHRNRIGDTYFSLMTILANEDFVWMSTVAIVLTLFLLLRNWKLALTYGMAVALGNLWLNPYVKDIFQRARPDETLRLVVADSYYFPSGHSFAAAMIYPLLAYILVYFTQLGKYRRLIYLLLVIVSLSIGFSRIYLGVHYLSDVIAGLSLGLSFYYFVIYFIEKTSLPN